MLKILHRLYNISLASKAGLDANRGRIPHFNSLDKIDVEGKSTWLTRGNSTSGTVEKIMWVAICKP